MNSKASFDYAMLCLWLLDFRTFSIVQYSGQRLFSVRQ